MGNRQAVALRRAEGRITRVDNWPRIKAVLEEALTRERTDRPTFVANACGGDEALRAQVERLLASRDLTALSPQPPAALLLDESRPALDLSGREFASYRLRSRLGAGGM